MRLPIVFHLRRDTSTRYRWKGLIGTSGLIPPVDIRCDYFLAIDHRGTVEIELHGTAVYGFAELTFMDGVIAPLSCRDAGCDGTVTTMAALKAGDFFTCGDAGRGPIDPVPAKGALVAAGAHRDEASEFILVR